MWRRAAWAALVGLVFTLGPCQVSGDSDGSALGIVKQPILAFMFSAKSVAIGDFSVDPYGGGSVPQPGYFLRGQRSEDIDPFRIDTFRWYGGIWRLFDFYNWWQFGSKWKFCDMNAGPMHYLESRRRSTVSDCKKDRWPFRGRYDLSPRGFVNRKGIEWIGDVVNRPSMHIDEGAQLSSSGFFLLVSDPNEETRKGHQKNSQTGDNNVGYFAFAYKLFTPFACGIWAFACAIIGRCIYVRTESPIIEMLALVIGLSGPLGAFCGLLLWWA